VARSLEITMRFASFVLIGITAGSALALAPATSLAQRAGQGSTTTIGDQFDLTPYVGYMVFGDFLSGPLGTSLSNAPAPIYGVQLGFRISPNVSMIGNLATGNTNIQAGIPILGGINVAQSSVLMYDAGLQFDLPVSSAYGTSFKPFVQAGVGGMQYTITESFLNTTATNLAGNVGIGADLAMGKGLGIRLMAKDYIGKFNFQQATDFNIPAGTTQNYAFSAGMRFSF
jgi:hypothetical protein